MHSSRPVFSFHVVAFALFAAFVAAGCGAGEGGVCQIPSDCASGLVCTCIFGGGGSGGRGICRATATTFCTGGTDSSVPDTGPRDVGTDTNPSIDANVDANVDGGLDAASAADAGSDAGSDAGGDAGTDAGSSSPDTGADANADAG